MDSKIVRLGKEYTYYADRTMPFFIELDGSIVTVKKRDPERSSFNYWVEDKDGYGSWADAKELEPIKQESA